MKVKIPLILFGFIVFAYSCKKDKDVTPAPTPEHKAFNLKFGFTASGEAVEFDTIKYVNAAGNVYSVTRLQFYISDVKLVRSDNSTVPLADWIYINARTPSSTSYDFHNVPEGGYVGMRFNFGLDSALNTPGGLPATIENLGMEWPVQMGGGYHFLKLEGHFMDTSGTPGYAMHLGTNYCMREVSVAGNFCYGMECNAVTISMNLDEWYQNPEVFDFNVDGNYIMGVMGSMKKFTDNIPGVFTLN